MSRTDACLVSPLTLLLCLGWMSQREAQAWVSRADVMAVFGGIPGNTLVPLIDNSGGETLLLGTAVSRWRCMHRICCPSKLQIILHM